MRCNDSRTRKQVNLRSHPLLLWFTWSFLRLKTTVSKNGAVLYGSRIFLFGREWLLYCYHVCFELFLNQYDNKLVRSWRKRAVLRQPILTCHVSKTICFHCIRKNKNPPLAPLSKNKKKKKNSSFTLYLW